MPTEVKEVTVLCWNGPSKDDCSAQDIASHMGARVGFANLGPAVFCDTTEIREIVPQSTCLIVGAETLVRIAKALPAGAAGLDGVRGRAQNIFIYGFLPTESHRSVLQRLSAGRLEAVQPLGDGDAHFEVMEGNRRWCGQFSGLAVNTADAKRDSYFLARSDETDGVMIRAAGKPVLVRICEGDSSSFFSACGELADLDESVPRQVSPLAWFSRLLPLMMFLRGSLGDRLWHNDIPRACFIIDDPLLKPRHGYLEYRGLVDSMKRRRFSTCIAFVPWNYRRSNEKVAAEFASNYPMASLCVHGCDHTGAEFADSDPKLLLGKALLALERMKTHRELCGAPFDDVMVFPQGLFSAEAMVALKAAGYLAAVNSDLRPSSGSATLTLRDLLEVAVTRFSGFPLFGRRYPRQLAEFAFDLFMGKPALAVEHHGYFRDGYQRIETFVNELNRLDERLEWVNVGQSCSDACLTRVDQTGDTHVRFYTSRFRLRNASTKTQTYVLGPRQTDDAVLNKLMVNGQERNCGRKNGQWSFKLSLGPGKSANISVSADAAQTLKWRGTGIYNLKVGVRRLLCELRDNYVHTNSVLGALSGIRNSLGTEKALVAR